MWEPILRGKFGARADDIAMSWLWSRVHERSLRLGYLRGGFQQLYDAFGERIRALGGTVLTGAAAAAIRPRDGGGRGGAPTRARRTRSISCWSRCRRACSRRLAAGAAARVRASATRARALRRPRADPRPGPAARAGVYWLNINDRDLPFLALVEHTNFLPPADYGGLHLVYLGNYLPMDHPLFGQSDDEVLDQLSAGRSRASTRLRRELGQAALGVPGAVRPADRHHRLPGARCRRTDAAAGRLSWPTWPTSIRRTAARTTACGWANAWRGCCFQKTRRAALRRRLGPHLRLRAGPGRSDGRVSGPVDALSSPTSLREVESRVAELGLECRRQPRAVPALDDRRDARPQLVAIAAPFASAVSAVTPSSIDSRYITSSKTSAASASGDAPSAISSARRRSSDCNWSRQYCPRMRDCLTIATLRQRAGRFDLDILRLRVQKTRYERHRVLRCQAQVRR